ncbi:MAG TPA: hypothetical protein VFC46_05495 [Humisphaera sp.]|nr:hypothetical protein [Humisphaera sp.]
MHDVLNCAEIVSRSPKQGSTTFGLPPNGRDEAQSNLRRRWLTRAIFLLAVIALSNSGQAYVRVTRDAPVVEHKTFDPANPPSEMPHLDSAEAAVTTSEFHIKAKADYEVVSKRATDSGASALISVHGITISTQLHVVVYVPIGASDKLKAHEEGHRKLAEKIYLDYALVAARSAGAQVDGRRFSGEGPDWTTAAQNAVNAPVRAMGDRYMELTSKRSSIVNDAYDTLTAHGVNAKPEEVAMAEALAQYEKDHPTTKPTKRASAK